jgi:hypothetical protein
MAMTASLTALAAVVWSDFAEASVEPQVQLADELPANWPVKVTKVEHHEVDVEDLFEPVDMPPPQRDKKGRLHFGNFEGY